MLRGVLPLSLWKFGAMSPSDELRTLITRSGWGDQAAFETLYQRTAPTLLSLGKRILGDTGLAEEAVQEAFVQAWYATRDYNPARGEPLAWLAGIVRHRALDALRREGRQQNRDQAAAEAPEMVMPGATGAGIATEDTQALMNCVEGLPQQQRQSLLLTYFHGYSNSELAERLTAPLGTVKSWVRRAMVSVRACLES